MCDQQYDVSEKFKRLFDLKQKQRADAKAYYLKLLYNPHRPGSDGMPFDPQLQRFSAMSAYHVQNFNPSAKHYAGFFMCFAPVVLLYYYINSHKKSQEAMLRSGMVKYSDRSFKWIF